jgi:hypothetical protein
MDSTAVTRRFRSWGGLRVAHPHWPLCPVACFCELLRVGARARMVTTPATPPAQSIDLVVTRYKEPVGWLNAYTGQPEWRVFLYNTGPRLPTGRLCRAASVSCTQVGNAGYEWHGYLRYLIDHYDALPSRTIFLQANPETVSPDITCLLNQTQRYLPVQPLSWVQQAKRKMPLFSECQSSFLGGCRVWVEPVTAGLRPMLHGDTPG